METTEVMSNQTGEGVHPSLTSEMSIADGVNKDRDSGMSTNNTDPHIHRGSGDLEKALGGVAPIFERDTASVESTLE